MSSGLGTPRDPPGGTGRKPPRLPSGRKPGGLPTSSSWGIPASPAATATRPRISGREWMDGWMATDAKASYFAHQISSSKRNPKVLFDTINYIVTPTHPDVPVFSNGDFSNVLSFFVDKVRDVRASISRSSTPLPVCPTWPSILNSFSPISLQDLIDLVVIMKTYSSTLDVLPTSMLYLGLLVRAWCPLFIATLQSGCVPSYFKHAVVQPLLKRLTLIHPKNYRPISMLPFISNI